MALARAVYSDPDVALLDDPLAAVDAATAQELVRNAVGPAGALQRALRVLATNQMWVLPLCDRVVVLDGGKAVETGTYAELLQANGKLCDVRSRRGAACCARRDSCAPPGPRLLDFLARTSGLIYPETG